MSAYNDPTVVHSAECTACYRKVRDADILDDNGECPSCVDERYQDEDGGGDDD